MKKTRLFGWTIALVTLVLVTGGCQDITGLSIQALTNSNSQNQSVLKASGTIHATEVHIASELGGRITEIRTKEGASVQSGDVLVVLDDTPWQMELAPARAAVDTARADLNMTQAKPRAEEVAAYQAALQVAQAQRDGTLRAWQDAQAQVKNPQDLDARIIDAQTQVKQAVQGVELAKAELVKAQIVRDRGTLNRETADFQVQAAEAALAAAQANEKTAEVALQQLQAIRAKPLALIAAANAAEGQYHIAQAAYQVAQARLDDLLAGATSEEIAVANATVHEAQAEANVARVQVAKCTLSSAVNGVVVSQALKPGEIAAPGATILTLANLREVTLNVFVPENRIGQVKLDGTVNVSVDNFPGKTFQGRVSRIGDSPEFTPRNVVTAEERLNTFYIVEVQLDNAEGLLRPGMPADATFGSN